MGREGEGREIFLLLFLLRFIGEKEGKEKEKRIDLSVVWGGGRRG